MLPQGHTHDEVDALFKMINTYLAGNVTAVPLDIYIYFWKLLDIFIYY
jgi:hypothetical protein